MEKLSALAEKMVGSEIVRLGNEINERKRKGESIYNFTIGDFDPSVFPIPKELEDLIIDAIYQGVIQGQLDQKRKQLEIEFAMGRDFKPSSIDAMIQVLSSW